MAEQPRSGPPRIDRLHTEPPSTLPPQTAPAGRTAQAGSRRPGSAGEVPWRVRDALLVVAVFALSQPLISLGIAKLLDPQLPPPPAGLTREAQLLAYLVPGVIVLSHLLGWALVWWLLTRRYALGLIDGLRLHRRGLGRLAGVFLGGMALQVVGAVLASFTPPPPSWESPVLRFLATGAWAAPVLFVLAVLAAPLMEEALFRGLLLPALRRRWSFLVSALVVTALFAGLHTWQTAGYWPAMGVIALCGFALAWLRERTGSLWPPIAFHMGFNFTSMLPVLVLGDRIFEEMEGWPALLVQLFV